MKMLNNERLTYKTQGDATRSSHYCTGPGVNKYAAVQRLGAYEDIGLSPEEIKPVKRGSWRCDTMGYDAYVECSECGLSLSTSNYIENEWREILNYCPCCGARMDGGEDNE